MKDFDIYSYYEINSMLMNAYKYSLYDLENMYPWEREIYIDLFNEFIKKRNEDNEVARQNM